MIPLARCRRTRICTSWAVVLMACVGATAFGAAADAILDSVPDPLAGTEPIDPAVTEPDPGDPLAHLLPPRTDTFADWNAGVEPLHVCGEPRMLPTCVPPPPCHPAFPPHPFDLIGVNGSPTCGPIYRGPCAPRTGSHDQGPHPRLHRLHDRMVDWFYSPRTPILP